MRIHTRLNESDFYSAALIARVNMTLTRHGSRSRHHAFNVTMRGESRRWTNSGQRGSGGGYAATWDQWGVFLAVLFAADQDLTIPRAYDDGEMFAAMTGDRFGAPEDIVVGSGYVRRFESSGWPEDAHGDHTFRFKGTPCEQSCTKCSAVQRWGVRALDYISR